jgi:hypothetical protein
VVKQFQKQGTWVYLTEFLPTIEAEIEKTVIKELAILNPQLNFCVNDAKEKLKLSK